jgi:integrase
LKGRPFNTQRAFCVAVRQFSEGMHVDPAEWRRMDKFEARDLAWQFIEPLKTEKSNKAMMTMAALKSFYRNLNGEQLPLDSARGGKHSIKVMSQKAATEHIPNKAEMYRIIDMAGNLRDKSILLTLFQAGLRVNALCRLTYGMVEKQLSQDLITLRITWDIDQKLRGYAAPFYFTYLNGEAAVMLRQYCEMSHKDSKPSTYLFYTTSKTKPVNQTWVWRIVKNCVKKAGLNPSSISTHTIRKAFRKVVRQSDTDDEFKEMVMGHSLEGSREAYFDRYDEEFFEKQYQKFNFVREVPQSEVTKLREQLEDKTSQMLSLEKRVEMLEEFIKKAVKPS